MDFKEIEKKWQNKWNRDKVFHAEVDNRKKFYIAFVYPYMSGLLHLGHLFTYTASEVQLRYKRMRGFNTLAKFGFHCTGTPIIAAAQRVKEHEPKQIQALKKMGIAEKEIPKFSDPEYWTTYFPKETLKDAHALGFSIDERYSFKTTYLNPPYDAFIAWQFNKLKEKGYVKKGKHPVVWCPKDNVPVGDHDRAEGEGETPQGFILFKFKLEDNRYIITATLRHDTVWGITNIYINPDLDYVEIQTKDQIWIVAEPMVKKLQNQDFDVHVLGRVKGEELVGKKVESFGGKKIIVLPATFLDPDYGTGLVHSVPSDSADDLIALQELQKDEKTIKKYNLDPEEVKAIKPIEIFNTPEIGANPAQYFLGKYNIKSQKERDKLEKIKKELYKLTFTQSTFGPLYKKGFSQSLEGLSIPDGQKIIKKELLEQGLIDTFYELTGEVVCRCLTKCIIKVVSDQWFLGYNDFEWKKLAHQCLDQMKLYPEKIRKQFDYVIDWLDHWACTREYGLGTKLPWDHNWVIESLSDSTIQMAYGTISKYLQHPEDHGFKIDKLNEQFFDYIFLSKGKAEAVEKSTGIPKKMIEIMKKDFEYWYPFDFRNSAKDLIQNHLAFCIFNHTAIFPKKHWPQAYAINGRIMVDNQKMSKSKGNFFTARELYEKHGADVVRLTSINAGEGLDDANFDMTFLETAPKKLNELHTFVKENYNCGRTERLPIDDWFESVLNNAVKESTQHMENIEFKSAILKGFLDLQRHLRWYSKRTDNNYHKNLINQFIETQVKLLAPFTPHLCEEMWSLIGKKTYVSKESWPEFDESKINPDFEKGEELIDQVMADINAVLKLAKIDAPKTITLVLSPQWKYQLFKNLKQIFTETRDFKEILIKAMTPNLKQYGKDIAKILPKYVKLGSVPDVADQSLESQALKHAQEFLSKRYGNAQIEIIQAEKSKEPKASQALPSKPAILVK